MFKNRRKFRSTKYEEHRKKMLSLIIALSLIVFALVVVGLSWLSGTPYFEIKEIEVKGNSVVRTEDVIQIAQKELKGNYLGLFSKSNSLIYSRNNVREEVDKAFSRFESVDIETDFMNKVVLTVQERTPVALWCGDEPSPDEICYFVDKKGYIFDEAPDFSGNVFIKLYSSDNKNKGVGKTFLDIETFTSLRLFFYHLDVIGLKAEVFISNEGGFGEIIVESSKLPVLNGTTIMFNLYNNLNDAVVNLETVLTSDEFIFDVNKNAQARLEYLDLRFGNRVYYRFETEEVSDSILSEELSGAEDLPQETQTSRYPSEDLFED